MADVIANVVGGKPHDRWQMLIANGGWWNSHIAMGSPLSPIMANIFMEEFEVKALSAAPHPQVCGKGLLMPPMLS